jgi:hypothetical protein
MSENNIRKPVQGLSLQLVVFWIMLGSSIIAAAVSSPTNRQYMYLLELEVVMLTEREDCTVVLVHQGRVRVLDLINLVKVLLSDRDLVGDVTGNGWRNSQSLTFREVFAVERLRTY